MGLDPERATIEQRQEATQTISKALLALEASGAMRIRPDAQRRIDKGRVQAAREAGVPDDVVSKYEREQRNPILARDENDAYYLNVAQRNEAVDRAGVIAGVSSDIVRARSTIWMRSQPIKRQSVNRYFVELDKLRDTLETEELIKLSATVLKDPSQMFRWREKYKDVNVIIHAESEKLISSLGIVEEDIQQQEGLRPEDMIARRYYDIEPEDADQNGIVDKREWETFRQKQQAVLAKASPEQVHYVTEEYPRGRWKDANVQAVYERYIAAQRATDTYFEIPKYFGLTVTDGDTIDTYIRGADALADQLVARLRTTPAGNAAADKLRIPRKWLWSKYASALIESGAPIDKRLLTIAMAINTNTKLRNRITSPARRSFLLEHGDIPRFYETIRSPLKRGDATRLGLIEPEFILELE